MRYVRTKSGKIFDTQYEPIAFKWDWHVKFIIDDNNLIVYDTVCKDRITNHGKILKQADTIDELCDEFVVVFEKPCVIGLRLPEKSRVKFIEESRPNAIYGAIWLDTGLKYIAKMNEKGELELL